MRECQARGRQERAACEFRPRKGGVWGLRVGVRATETRGASPREFGPWEVYSRGARVGVRATWGGMVGVRAGVRASEGGGSTWEFGPRKGVLVAGVRVGVRASDGRRSARDVRAGQGGASRGARERPQEGGRTTPEARASRGEGRGCESARGPQRPSDQGAEGRTSARGSPSLRRGIRAVVGGAGRPLQSSRRTGARRRAPGQKFCIGISTLFLYKETRVEG